jgi:uncharacterized membrane protein
VPKKKRSRDKREIVDPSEPQQRRLIQAQVEASVTSGPLPPPEVLIRYNEAVPNGAERIMVMAEKQNDHRIKQEAKVIDEDIRRQRWGLALGFIVALAGLAAASYISVYASPIAGAVVAALDLGGMVGAFVYGSRGRRSEREQRAEIMTGRG